MELADRSKLDGPLKESGFVLLDDTTGTIDFDMGPQETAWRMGTLTVNAKLKELDAAGTHGDVWARVKAAYGDATKNWIVDGRVKAPPSSYRLIVAKRR